MLAQGQTAHKWAELRFDLGLEDRALRVLSGNISSYYLIHPSFQACVLGARKLHPRHAPVTEGDQERFLLLNRRLQGVGSAVPSWALASLPFLELRFLPRTPFLSQHLHLPLLKSPSLLKATSQGRPLACSGGQSAPLPAQMQEQSLTQKSAPSSPPWFQPSAAMPAPLSSVCL